MKVVKIEIFGRPVTIIFIVSFFIYIGVVPLLLLLLDLLTGDTFELRLIVEDFISVTILLFQQFFLIAVAYGLWNFKKWAGILGILYFLATIFTKVYISTSVNEMSFVESLLELVDLDVLVIILIILNWNNLTPKFLAEIFSPAKKWLHNIQI